MTDPIEERTDGGRRPDPIVERPPCPNPEPHPPTVPREEIDFYNRAISVNGITCIRKWCDFDNVVRYLAYPITGVTSHASIKGIPAKLISHFHPELKPNGISVVVCWIKDIDSLKEPKTESEAKSDPTI